MNGILDKEAIERLFRENNHQHDVLIGLYRMVIPDWDKIRKLNGWPSVNSYTWHEICKLFIQFDRKHHPNCIAGGCWMNSGFSIEDHCSDWQYDDIAPDKIIYIGQHNKVTGVFVLNYGSGKHVRFDRLISPDYPTGHYRQVTKSSYRRLAKILLKLNYSTTYKGYWTV